MPREGRKPPKWVRLSSLGMELAAAVGGCALIGYWIDRRAGSDPWGVVVGVTLGFIGGMYNLLRTAIRAFHEPEPPAEDRPAEGSRSRPSDGERPASGPRRPGGLAS